MRRDIFISYSSQDAETAGAFTDYVERHGITCWIASRDIPPGVEFEQAILDAIDSASAVVLILSNSANTSPFVKSEINHAFTIGKSIFTLRIEDVVPTRALTFYLKRHQWMDGFPPPLEQKLDRLLSTLLELNQQINCNTGAEPKESLLRKFLNKIRKRSK